jgi:hypothetical protein
MGAVGGVAALVLAAAFALKQASLILPALALLGGEYAVLFLVRDDTVDQRAPLYAAGFVLVGELAFAALERRAGTPEPRLVLRRVAAVVALGVGAVALGTAVLAAAALPVGGGVGLEAVGVLAAVGALVLLGRLAGRSS